jgi:hypothetical protein
MQKQWPKRCRVLAGKAREHIRRELERRLECPVDWRDMRRHDSLKRLRAELGDLAELAHLSLLLVAPRFLSKGTNNLVRDARRLGIRVVVLRSGLNPAQVEHQLRQQRVSQGGNAGA